MAKPIDVKLICSFQIRPTMKFVKISKQNFNQTRM